jgi:hypothetical protein
VHNAELKIVNYSHILSYYFKGYQFMCCNWIHCWWKHDEISFYKLNSSYVQHDWFSMEFQGLTTRKLLAGTRVMHPLRMEPRSIAFWVFFRKSDPSRATRIELGHSLITRSLILCTFTLRTPHIAPAAYRSLIYSSCAYYFHAPIRMQLQKCTFSEHTPVVYVTHHWQ